MKVLFKKKLTKRRILFLVNGIFFACIIIFCCLNIIDVFPFLTETRTAYISLIIYRFALIQCVFTFLSFIVYYLSIMADALNRKYEEQVKNRDKK